jgi:hypothetical protein
VSKQKVSVRSATLRPHGLLDGFTELDTFCFLDSWILFFYCHFLDLLVSGDQVQYFAFQFLVLRKQQQIPDFALVLLYIPLRFSWGDLLMKAGTVTI